MVKRTRLSTLAHLAAALLEAEQARLRTAMARRTKVESRIADLDAAVTRQHQVISAELEAPVAGRVLDSWGTWADRRRMALNTDLAQERLACEDQRQIAMKAFGRAEALKTLQAKAADAAKLDARRRARKLD